MKKITSVILALLLTVAMAMPAFAAEGEENETPCSHVNRTVETVQDATCTEAGCQKVTCNDCNEIFFEPIPARNHTWGSRTSLDGTYHSMTCSVCQATSSEAHTWNQGTVDTEATCTSVGRKTFTCSGCGQTKSEEIPKTSHTYGNWTITPQSHSRICSVCSTPESGNHTWGTPVKVEPTCTQEGSETKICTACNYTIQKTLPKADHTYDNACDPECNVCKATRSVSHKYSQSWSTSKTEHWHECTVCGDKKDLKSHVPGPAATEKEAQTCLTCGYVIAPKKNHVHKFGTTLVSDSTGHWYACNQCDEKQNFQQHTYEKDCSSKCTMCGYVRNTTHKFGDEYFSDKSGHWQVCSVCGEKSKAESHSPGAEATTTAPQLCKVCGYEVSPVIDHVHDGGDVWMKDEISHWKQCSCGERLEENLHSWKETVQNKDSTTTYICSVCQQEHTEGEPSGMSVFLWWAIRILISLIILVSVAIGVIFFYTKYYAENQDQGGRFSQ